MAAEFSSHVKRLAGKRELNHIQGGALSSSLCALDNRPLSKLRHRCPSRKLDPSGVLRFRCHNTHILLVGDIPCAGDACTVDACAGDVANVCQRVECGCRGAGRALDRSDGVFAMDNFYEADEQFEQALRLGAAGALTTKRKPLCNHEYGVLGRDRGHEGLRSSWIWDGRK